MLLFLALLRTLRGGVGGVVAALAVLLALTNAVPAATGDAGGRTRVTTLPGAEIGAGPRLALVIGNGRYSAVRPLKNPVADARAVAQALTRLGFTTTLAEDLSRLAMNETIGAFLNRVTPATEVVVYYAGHGVEAEGANYLLPTDIPALRPEQARLLRTEAVSLTDLLADLERRAARVSLIILDACRDNPFETDGRSLGSTRGLARVEAPLGTFVLYAAGAGQAALDTLGPSDDSENGVFARHLLPLLDEEGLELRTMVRQLRERVRTAALASGGQSQIPSYYDQLLGDFYLKPRSRADEATAACRVLVNEAAEPGTALALDPAPARAACTAVLAADPTDEEARRLLALVVERETAKAALDSGEAASIEGFLKTYPKSALRGLVVERLGELGAQAGPPADKAGGAPAVTTAALAPADSAPPGGAAPETADERALALAVQAELNRLGCDAGPADGAWGRRSRAALEAFAKRKRLALAALEPAPDLLDLLKAEEARVCPRVCGPRFRLDGDACVAKTCPEGQALSSRGECYTPKTVEPKAKTVQPKAKAAQPKKPATPAKARARAPKRAVASTAPRRAQAAETPKRPRKATRRRPAAVAASPPKRARPAAASSQCFVFNGERVCQ